MNNKNKKVLITGATGFIGRHLTKYLVNQGYEVLCPTSLELDCTDCARVHDYLAKHRPDVVFHLAVNGHDINKRLETNLKLFLSFYKNRDLYGKMIYAGSGAEYDKSRPIRKVREEEIDSIPQDIYGLAKHTINELVEKSENIYNLRIFGIFGPGENYKTKFISGLCCKAIHDVTLTIRQDCFFDYLWIDDFCKIAEKFMLLNKPQHHAYNVASGRQYALSELAQKVRSISGKELNIVICKPGMANEYTADISRIAKEIPDMEITDIEQSIGALYDYYKSSDIDVYELLY